MSPKAAGAEQVRETVNDAADAQAELPRPLMRELPPADSFPVDALGSLLKPAALAINDRVHSPLAICGQSVLAAATLAALSRFIAKSRSAANSEYVSMLGTVTAGFGRFESGEKSRDGFDYGDSFCTFGCRNSAIVSPTKFSDSGIYHGHRVCCPSGL